ncbi:MAG: YncE family protein, partial [Chthonomonadales bacterium]|nr:YncE family protein [Chthonomonadales bacterium]
MLSQKMRCGGIARWARPSRRITAVLAATIGLTAMAMQTSDVHIGEQPDGSILVPTGQRLTPIGRWLKLMNERPKDLVVSPDGSMIAALSPRRVTVFSSSGELVAESKSGGGPLGIGWRPDGTAVYYSSGANVMCMELGPNGFGTPRPIAVELAGSKGPGQPNDPQAAGLAVSPDGKRLFVALGTRNAVAVVDPTGAAAPSSIPVGVCPYHVALSPDGRTLWVSNRGGSRVASGRGTAKSAGTEVRVERATDAAARGSVSVVDTGTLAVREIPVGRQPAGLAFSRDGARVYVANSDSDSISVIDAKRMRVIRTHHLSSRTTDFGHMPTGVALSDDERTLYVSCGGSNAVGIVPLGSDGLPERDAELALVPTAWFPIAIRTAGQSLWVACAKGFGSMGDLRQGGRWVHASAGVVQLIKPDDMADVPALTARVAMNNGWNAELPARRGMAPVPVPERVGEPSVFRHVVYVIKENHTYDMTLGDMKEGNGDPKLCLFGEEVTPNQHAIAREFVLLDNTYTSGTNSADGHQWTSSSVCNAYMEQNYSSYARSYPYDGGDPLAYSPKGFLWSAAARSGLSVRVFGEFVNRPRIIDTQA